MYPLFEGLSESVVSGILKKGKQEVFPEGTVLVSEGHVSERLYVLESGEVEIRKEIRGRSEVLGIRSTGDFFGELVCVGGKRNWCSVVATQRSTAVSFAESEIAPIVAAHPEIFRNMAKVALDRLRTSDDALKNHMEIQELVDQKEIARLNAVVEATQTVNSSLELSRVLELILQEAMRITYAERGTIYLIDESEREISARVIAGKEISEIRQPVGTGISGYVAQTGETVNIGDAYSDSRFNPEIDRKSGFKTKNILCMPMRNREKKIIGVFQLINKRHGAIEFDREDENFLTAFSVNAALAIENSRLARQMVQAERLSAIGRMAGAIVHDIKNPMSTIRLYAQVLKKKSGDGEAPQLVDEIIKQIDRLVNMAQEVLDFSRGVSEMNFQPVVFEDFLRGVLGFEEKDFERKQIVLTAHNEYAGSIEIDGDKITRVLLNIMGNAADAMPKGGTLDVSARPDGNMLTIQIKDTGIGIPEEIRRKIFEPFVTYGKKSGTGLGMAIVKKIVDDHHGTIDIDSTPGKGTTMTVRLPFKQK